MRDVRKVTFRFQSETKRELGSFLLVNKLTGSQLDPCFSHSRNRQVSEFISAREIKSINSEPILVFECMTVLAEISKVNVRNIVVHYITTVLVNL